MTRVTRVGTAAACLCLSLAAPALAISPASSPPDGVTIAAGSQPVATADVPIWRQRQIAAAQPVNSRNTPSPPEELLGTAVRSPRNEALGSIENLVKSPTTDKLAYLVIALDRSFGVDDISVPVPFDAFRITPNANLLVLDTTRDVLAAAPRVNPFSPDGIDLQSQKVDAYWKAHFARP